MWLCEQSVCICVCASVWGRDYSQCNCVCFTFLSFFIIYNFTQSFYCSPFLLKQWEQWKHLCYINHRHFGLKEFRICSGNHFFTFVDFIILFVHLCFQDVALNEPLHNLLWEEEWRSIRGRLEGADKGSVLLYLLHQSLGWEEQEEKMGGGPDKEEEEKGEWRKTRREDKVAVERRYESRRGH